MQSFKKSMLVGAGVATIGLAGLSGASLVSAATNHTSATGNSSLVDKISSTFDLDKAKVQAVFDEDRKSHMADMETKRAEALKQAVTDKKLTQAQADHITAAWKEIKVLRGDITPEDETDAVRAQIKEKMDALRSWAEEQGINLRDIVGLGSRGHGPGGNGHGFKANNSTVPESGS